MGNILNTYTGLKDKKLKEVIVHSCGFHHAGMVRTDRNAVEKMFAKG
jgi:replicative superfamily II helicase